MGNSGLIGGGQLGEARSKHRLKKRLGGSRLGDLNGQKAGLPIK